MIYEFDKTRTKFIEDAWATYRATVLPPTAGVTQVEETRKGFYAGAACVWDIMVNRIPDLPDEEAYTIMSKLGGEFSGFIESLKAEASKRRFKSLHN